MSVDLFSKSSTVELLHNKQVWFFGDSNTRSIYKDLVWLLEHGTLVPQVSLRTENEMTHANDYRTSNMPLTSGRNYEETREYYNDVGTVVTFTFLTKMFSENVMRAFEKDGSSPDVVVFNSCVWDLTRWGPNGVAEYKKNVVHTMKYFKNRLPGKCLVVFTTTLPLSSSCKGGFLKKPVEFLRYQLPWHVIEANNFLAEMAKLYRYDVLDLHYYMRFLRDEWSPDGMHWSPLGYRLITNLLLTHLALSFNVPLPGVYVLDEKFIQKSQNSGCVVGVDNRSGKKRKEKVIDSNKTKKLRVNCEPNLLLEIKCDSGPASTSNFSVIDECNNESTESEIVNVVHIQTKEVGPDSKQLNVETNEITSNQGGNVVETKHILSLHNEIVGKDLSQTKQSEVVNSKQLNEMVTKQDACGFNFNNNLVETKQIVSVDLFSNNEIVVEDLSQAKQSEVVDSKQLKIQDRCAFNNSLVETNRECNNQNNISKLNQLNVDTEINQPEIENNPVIISNLPYHGLIETKQLTVGDTKLVGNNESIVATDEIVGTTPNKDLNRMGEPIKINSVVGSQCFNEFTVRSKLISTVLELDTKQIEIEHQDVVVETKGATEPTLPINAITNSQETNNFINTPDFSKANFGFAFFIEAFAPQLELLK